MTQPHLNLDQAKLSLATARHDLENARLQLAAAMGLNTALRSELAPDLELDKPDVDLKDELRSARVHRSELRQQEARIAALNAQAAAAKQSAYPTVFGRLAYRIEGAEAEQPGFVAGIGIQGPLFDGFAIAAKSKEARAHVRVAEAEMAVTQQQI